MPRAAFTDLALANAEVVNLDTENARLSNEVTRLHSDLARARASHIGHYTVYDTVTVVVVLLIGLLIAGGYLYSLTGDRFWDLGFHKLLPITVAVIAGLLLLVAGAILSRLTTGYAGEWKSTLMICIGAAIFIWMLVLLPDLVAHEMVPKNPTIFHDRSPEDCDEIHIQSMDLPKNNATFQDVRVVVQIEKTISATDAKAVSEKTPFTVCVPKGSQGKVFFDSNSTIGDQAPSLSSSY